MTGGLAGADRCAESPSQEAIPEGLGGACGEAGSIVGRAAVVTGGDAAAGAVSHGAREAAGGIVVERLAAGDSAGQLLVGAGTAAAVADENLDSWRLAVLSGAAAVGGATNPLAVDVAGSVGGAAGAMRVAGAVGAAAATGWLAAGDVVAMAAAGWRVAAASCTAFPAAAMKLAGESGQSNDVSTRSS